MATRTYWLSFCDGARPTGQQFLGAVIVDVTADEAQEAVAQWEALHGRPMHDQGEGPWIAGAIRNCWRAKVNPGGEVASVRIDDNPEFPVRSPFYPRLQLLDRAAMDALDRASGHTEQDGQDDPVER